ncbi:MAG: ABC transporter permease [Terracidiphilus sp.]
MSSKPIFNTVLARYVLKRLCYATIVLIFISFFAFLVIQLPPGDFLDSYIEQLSRSGMGVDSATLIALRHAYGLDRPMIVQYWEWVTRFLHGDMGVSLLYAKKVSAIIRERLPWTLLLTFGSMLLTYAIAIPIGIYSARRQYSVGDFAFSFLAFVGMATPGFLLALALMWLEYILFGVTLGGLQSPRFMLAPMSWAKAWDLIEHLPIPLVVIGVAGMANYMRIIRGTLLDELGKPYVTTARAKGLKDGVLIWRYPVRAALNPLISAGGWLLAELFSGDTVAGIVLGLPTIGPVMYRALLAEDMYLAAACVMIMSVLTVVGFLISDIVLALTDPRIRLS